ncbi:hypothetical protein [Haliangium ochraceum]|uniref:Uncharacterized protein n=1 Tax=Haliangium ochraceum (strain DSM 14365 / JCM 11303 / SMP-2) TaxID=502025 RepID=D0LSY9_HALO1|nr:hypothetical protein [Haliangium ochraceum]ACY19125.1 hypothetical protein Hoch_6659 [Haliangium ochraceum DSM 14365]
MQMSGFVSHSAIRVGALSLLLALSTATGCGDDGGDGGSSPDAAAADAAAADAAPQPDAGPPVAAIEVSDTEISVTEGDGTGQTITVRLSAAPAAAVSVTLSSSDEEVVVATPASFDFGSDDFADEQTVTVTAPDDDSADNESATLTFSADGYADVVVTVQTIDSDAMNIVVDGSDTSLIEGASETRELRLSIAPAGAFEVALSSSDDALVSVEPATLSFDADNFDQPQEFTITALRDDNDTADSATITLRASGDDTVPKVSFDVTVAEEGTPPLGVLYVRGSFNDFGVTAPMSYEASSGLYEAELVLSDAVHGFKIADEGFSDDATYSIDANAEVELPVGETRELVVAIGFGNNTLLDLQAGGGVYEFTVDANDPAKPTLVVREAQR